MAELRPRIMLRFIGPLKEIIGRGEIYVTLTNRVCIDNLADLLLSEIGERAECLVDHQTSKLFSHIVILINGRHVSETEMALTSLQNGDNVTFMPAITGGLV